MIKLEQVSLEGRLEDLCLTANKGEFIHLLGANGAGKSSLLAVIAGLIDADEGEVYLREKLLSELNISALANYRTLQEQDQQTVFPVTTSEALSFFSSHDTLPDMLESALEINQFSLRPLSQLSGGELRRVQIARSLLQIWQAVEEGEGIILLDEPIQGLDIRHQHLLCKLMTTLAGLGNTIVLSHHDLNLCQQYASKVWLMVNNQLLAQGPPVEILQDLTIKQAFDCAVRRHEDGNGHILFQTHL